MEKTILLIGGAGYLGSHIAVALQRAGFEPVIIDGLYNGDEDVGKRIFKITNMFPDFYKVDLLEIDQFERIFNFYNNVIGAIHCSGLRSESESCKKPFSYYQNNVVGTLNLMKILNKYNVKNVIFNSDMNVYGDNKSINGLKESDPAEPLSPLGSCNIMIERILKDLSMSNSFNIVSLRNSSVIGSDESGLIGDFNIRLYKWILDEIFDVAAGKKDKFMITGGDRKTHDGTYIRDYIHVMDIAEANVKAIEYLLRPKVDQLGQSNFDIINIGTGRGLSVKELIKLTEDSLKLKIPYDIARRTHCQTDMLIVDTACAKEKLKWESRMTVEQAIKDAWNYYNIDKEDYTEDM